jgi:hypothetical protein
MLITGGMFLEDWVRTAEFDADQLETLMVAAFELLGSRRIKLKSSPDPF